MSCCCAAAEMHKPLYSTTQHYRGGVRAASGRRQLKSSWWLVKRQLNHIPNDIETADLMNSCTACRNLEPLPGLSGGFITGGFGQDLQHSAPGCLLCSILWEGLETFCLESPTTVQWIALRQDGESFRLQYKQTPNDKRWMGLHFYTTDCEFIYIRLRVSG